MSKRPHTGNGDEGCSRSKQLKTGGNGDPKDRPEIRNRAIHKLMEISDAVRECKEALKLVRENQRGLGARMKKLEDNQKEIISLVSSRKKATFTIKGSEFEVSCIYYRIPV